MEKECEMLSKCGFFKKYNNSYVVACKGFIAMYCKGDKMNECKRLEYKKKHGVAPSDNMMPSGHFYED